MNEQQARTDVHEALLTAAASREKGSASQPKSTMTSTNEVAPETGKGTSTDKNARTGKEQRMQTDVHEALLAVPSGHEKSHAFPNSPDPSIKEAIEVMSNEGDPN